MTWRPSPPQWGRSVEFSHSIGVGSSATSRASMRLPSAITVSPLVVAGCSDGGASTPQREAITATGATEIAALRALVSLVEARQTG